MKAIKTQGNFMVYGPQGERRAAFALESDKRLFEAALEEAVQPACVNCGQPCGPNKPWDDSCPHCHKPLGLPVEDVAERRYCPASALHDPNATPAPPCGFALDCIYGDKCPAGEVGPSVLTRAHAPAQPTPGPWFDWVEYREQHGRSVVAYRDDNDAIVSVLNCEQQEANARFIVEAAQPAPDPKTVFVVLVIKAGILEASKVFADEDAANEFWDNLQAEYNIDPLNPDSCAEDVLCLREVVT